MSEIIVYPLPSGANYVIPDIGDENWGQNVTDFLVAIPAGTMPTSGTFSLTGDVFFGPSFGLVSQYFKTPTINPASAGFVRLSKTDAIEWRNNANSANLPLAVNGSDQLTFNGVVLTTGTSVTSITGTANQVTASAPTGAVTLSLPSSLILTGASSLAASSGSLSLTGSPIVTSGTVRPASDNVDTLGDTTHRWANVNTEAMNIYGFTSGNVTIQTPSTVTSYLLTLPSAQGANHTTLQNDGAGNLTYGFVPLATGVTGILATANGGTGVTSLGNLTDAGTDGITVTGGTGALITSASISQHVADASHNGYLSSADWSTFNSKGSGTVSSVALTVPAFLSVSGSPVTSSGTLAVSLSGTALPVANGGTGSTSFTANAPIVAGTTSTGPFTVPSGGTGTTGQLLQSQGTGSPPIWATIATGSGTVSSGTAHQFAYYAASNNVVSASGVDITNPTFASVSLTGSLPIQITGATHNTIITATNPTADRTYNFPDAGANSDIALASATQTFSGNNTFSGTTTLSGLTASTSLALDGSKHIVSVTQTGTGNAVLATSPTLVTPNIGAATMGGNLNANSNKITSLASATTSGDALSWGQAFTAGNITFSPTTSGIVGTTTNDNASAGGVGEYISSTVSNVTFPTSNTFGDGTSISLTAGDWDITATTAGTSTTNTVSGVTVGISTTAGNSSTGLVLGDNEVSDVVGPTVNNNTYMAVPSWRRSLSTTTTIYLKFQATYTGAAPSLYARLSARRVR